MVNNEKIIEIIKKLEVVQKQKIPVADTRIYENEVSSYNYIIVRKGKLRKSTPGHFVRQVEVVYVFDQEQKINDFDIINEVEKLGVKFVIMNPDEVQIGSTNNWVTMNTYIFEGPEKG